MQKIVLICFDVLRIILIVREVSGYVPGFGNFSLGPGILLLSLWLVLEYCYSPFLSDEQNGMVDALPVVQMGNLSSDGSQQDVVYAFDEFGNQVAVGYFVTNSFENLQPKAESPQAECAPEKLVLDGMPNGSWVGAVEECKTAASDDYQLVKSVSQEERKPIRHYKVNRVNRNSPKGNCRKDVKGRKTLTELKKVKSQRSKFSKKSNLIKIKLRGNKELAKLSEVKKKSRKRKKMCDKVFPIPSCVQRVKFESLYNICI